MFWYLLLEGGSSPSFSETSIISINPIILHLNFIQNQVHMVPECMNSSPSNASIFKVPMSDENGVRRDCCFFQYQSIWYYIPCFIFILNVKMGICSCPKLCFLSSSCNHKNPGDPWTCVGNVLWPSWSGQVFTMRRNRPPLWTN